MASYDLTPQLIKYLDRHQVLNLLTFLQEKQLYRKEDLLKSNFDLVSKTKMVDIAIEHYKLLHNTNEVPKEMEDLRKEVVDQYQNTNVGPLWDLIRNEDVVAKLKEEQHFNMEYLTAEYNIKEEDLNSLYASAKFYFDCGQYPQSAEMLFSFRELSKNEEKSYWALWGKLAAEILMQNRESAHWEVAYEDLKELKDLIDKRVFTEHLQQLQQRTWLIHWSLFVWFSFENGLSLMTEFFFSEKLLNTIQTNCPHILRYLAVAAIINKRRKNTLKDVVRLLVQEKASHSDPITEFLLAIVVEFDFELAHEKLKECEVVVANDFFLDQNGVGQDFIKSARLLMFETYCKVHKCIDINELGSRLDIKGDLQPEIMKFIQECKVEAKIDSAKNQVVTTTGNPSIYQQVTEFEKVKLLASRSRQVAIQIEKKYAMLDNKDL